jgi:hypothetical protein
MERIQEKTVETLDKDLPQEDRVIQQALSRFRNALNSELHNRLEAAEDLRMLAGQDHWPAEVVLQRELEGRPVLTVNKLPGFADRVINEGRVNQIAIKIIPRGGGASKEVAETLTGLIRAIEQESDSEVAYQTAFEGAVQCGFGYFRVVTSYTEDSPFDQEIRIERIKNNFSVVLDPARTKADGSDSRFAFITEMISVEEYEARYPDADVPSSLPDDGANADVGHWFEDASVRVGEYWVKVPHKKRVYLLSDSRVVDGDEWDEALPLLKEKEQLVHVTQDPQTGQPIQVPGPAPEGSGLPEMILNEVPRVEREREIDSHKVQQYIIDGQKVISGPHEWPGKFIPIVPVWGKEITVDGQTHLRGAIRNAKDSQRMYNYFRTAATETVALAPKAPWVGTAEQFEGYEEEWADANRSNRAFLAYNHVAGVNPPMRQIVTQTAIGEITESNISSDEMKDTTSIQDASLGAQGNEVSGLAIARRQSQSDVVNFTYADNRRRAVKFCGEIILDLIPRIYDTERQVMIIRPDDEEEFVTVNQVVPSPVSDEPLIVNDLSLGTYGVSVTTGPSFQTQRQEAAASMLDFVRTAPDAARFVIDLIAENMDWPGATKIANRLRKLLPPGIDEDGPPPPQEPSIDDVIKKLRAEGITLANEKKMLDIKEQRDEMTDEGKAFDRVIEVLEKYKRVTDEPKGGTSGRSDSRG